MANFSSQPRLCSLVLTQFKNGLFTVWTEKTRLMRLLSSLSFNKRRNRLVLKLKVYLIMVVIRRFSRLFRSPESKLKSSRVSSCSCRDRSIAHRYPTGCRLDEYGTGVLGDPTLMVRLRTQTNTQTGLGCSQRNLALSLAGCYESSSLNGS